MDLPREQIAKGVKASVLLANERALNEWSKKYERLGDALEEAFRVRGFRIESREMGLIHAVAETDSGIAIFVCEPGYERLLEGLQTVGQFTRSYPQIRKSVWDELFELIPWMDSYWGPLPLPYYLTQSFEEDEMNPEQFQEHKAEINKQHGETIAALNLLVSQQQQLITALAQSITQPAAQPAPQLEQSSGIIAKIKAHWESLSVLGVILLAGGLGAIYIAGAISAAVSPINQTLSGPPGHPEQGLVMDVRSITGYTDANGNKVKGKLEAMDEKMDALLNKTKVEPTVPPK